jgi:methylmalonyl-CoA/ethylmalonyl-CoA epimerase
MKLEHIGIAVKNAQQTAALYADLFGPAYKEELVESEQVRTVFFRAGQSKVELLEATDPESVIAKFIEKRGEGLHHVAFEVSDIVSEMKRLEGLGYQLLSPQPKRGADNKLICFLHPKTTGGVLIELCQELK